MYEVRIHTNDLFIELAVFALGESLWGYNIYGSFRRNEKHLDKLNSSCAKVVQTPNDDGLNQDAVLQDSALPTL